MRIVLSSGHGKLVIGAVGHIDELTENRRVVDRVAAIMKAAGHTVVVHHDDTSKTVRDNINSTVAVHNSNTRELDVQVHFNAFQKTASPRGTECLYRSPAQKPLAAKVSAAVAAAGGFIDRGAKDRTNLGFLNGTKVRAILPEICFVDSKADVDLYQKNFEPICQALAKVLGDA